MKYIKKISLKNFQSHENTSLDLDPFLNVIVGASDSGKSAIIRAIKWVLFNEPSGDFYIKEGKKEASVSLLLSDGNRVTRLRSKSKNMYIINYNNGEDLSLSGFGLTVPKEVQEITEIIKVPFSPSSKEIVNIAEQLNGPFLLSENNSTKAFVIGGLVGVDLVDDSIVDILKDLRSLNSKKKLVDEDLKKLNEDLKSYKKIEDLGKTLADLKLIRNKIDLYQVKLEELKKIKLSYNEILTSKKNIEEVVSKLSMLEESRTIYSKILDYIDLYKEYSLLEEKYISIKENQAKMKEYELHFKDIDLVKDKTNKLEYLTNYYEKAIYMRTSYYQNKSEIEKNKEFNEKLKYIAKIKDNEESISLYIDKYNSYSNIYALYQDLLKRLDLGRNYINYFKNLSYLKNLDLSLETLIENYLKLIKIYANKLKLEEESKLINKDIEIYKKDISLISNTYGQVLLDNKTCPICFNEIEEGDVDSIVKKLMD